MNIIFKNLLGNETIILNFIHHFVVVFECFFTTAHFIQNDSQPEIEKRPIAGPLVSVETTI